MCAALGSCCAWLAHRRARVVIVRTALSPVWKTDEDRQAPSTDALQVRKGYHPEST